MSLEGNLIASHHIQLLNKFPWKWEYFPSMTKTLFFCFLEKKKWLMHHRLLLKNIFSLLFLTSNKKFHLSMALINALSKAITICLFWKSLIGFRFSLPLTFAHQFEFFFSFRSPFILLFVVVPKLDLVVLPSRIRTQQLIGWINRRIFLFFKLIVLFLWMTFFGNAKSGRRNEIFRNFF